MKKILTTLLVLSLAFTMFFSCGQKESVNEFIINNGTEPQSLDPSKIEGVPEHRIYMALFEGLVSYDPKTSDAVPGVAESWTRSENDTVVTFKLRDAVWSDGVKITAQTFVDSWLYYLAPETAAVYAYMPGMIIEGAAAYNAGEAGPEAVGIRAIDDKTLEVRLVGPLAYAVDVMAHYSFAPLPLHAMEKYGEDWIKPGNLVGNGPFTLETWTPQQSITVVPNEKYWNKDEVYLDRITFLTIENETTAYQKYKAGEMDWDTSVPLEMLDEIKLRDDFQSAPQLSSYYYYLNTQDPILSDVRVRKALTMAIDREELVNKVTKGGQIASGGFVPSMTGYDAINGNEFDLDTAKALLAEAGYPNGEGFPKMSLIYNTNEGHKKIAEYVQQAWKKNLGIDVELANLEWNTFLDERQSGNFQIGRAGWVGDYQDPSNFLELFLTDGGNNDGKYSNPEFDALMAKAATMPAGEERMAVLKQAEEILITQDQAIIPFYFYVTQNMIDLNTWEGWYANTLDIHPYVGLKRK